MTVAILAEKVTKFYPPRISFRSFLSRSLSNPIPALRELSMEVKKGEIYGLLGENGAGKTTLMKSIATAILPTSGKITVNGYDVVKEPFKVKNIMGFVSSEGRSFYWRLTGMQNLMFFARLYGLKDNEARSRINYLLEEFELNDYASKSFKDYSSGVQQRFSIVRGLLNKPEVLLLDEPTRSLDPAASNIITSHLEKLNREKGITILMSTHDLDEAAKLCHNIGIIRKGELCRQGTVKELAFINGEKCSLEEAVLKIFKGVQS